MAMLVTDPFSPTLLLLAGLWLAAKLGGELALRLKLPAVSGELGVGLGLAALRLHVPWIPDVAESPEATVLANLTHRTACLTRRIQHLEGLLPICAWCKRIRDDHGTWLPLETLISQNSDVAFTHGICPDCKGSFQAKTRD